ncbi:MAG: hypothetical protein Gaeavirus13_10 [Gaeavirus sp.]|uniref:Uncharacterized protein n=1 Tax=Gaeavirus sp. TaxID=2487767 RepID=A0A3G4ZZ35_9VIRU|nr:MAG: hypothetical protein Gaeavirus13_10 [Gaeavirus sp.]
MANVKITLYIEASVNTNDFVEYWDAIAKFYRIYENDIVESLIWSDEITSPSWEDLQHANKHKYINKYINQYAFPSLISKHVLDNNIKNKIVIFSTGTTPYHLIAAARYIMGDYFVAKICHQITSKSIPDISIINLFHAGNNTYVAFLDYMFEYVAMKRICHSLIHVLNTVHIDENYEEKFDVIESLLNRILITEFENECRLNLIQSYWFMFTNLILVMKKRLVEEQEIRNLNRYSLMLTIRNFLKDGLLDKAIAMYNVIDSTDDNGLLTNRYIDAKVKHLISVCSGIKHFASTVRGYDDIIRFADENIAEVRTAVVEIKESETNYPYECPIMMTNGVAQIMVIEPEHPIFEQPDNQILGAILEHPLSIVNYPDVVAKIKNSISQCISADITQLNINPFTRQKLLGMIPLGLSQKDIEHGNLTIEAMFTSKIDNRYIHLYFVVIWYLINRGDFEFLNDIKSQVKEHMMFRLINYNSLGSICRLNYVPHDITMWYCVNLIGIGSLGRTLAKYHSFDLITMFDIVKEFGYPVSDHATKHVDRLRVLLSMLEIYNMNMFDFRCRIKCLIMCGIRTNVKLPNKTSVGDAFSSWIPVDGLASEQQVSEILDTFPSYYKKLYVDELVGLASKIDMASNVYYLVLPTDWIPNVTCLRLSIRRFSVHTYGEYCICPATFRPYYNITYLREYFDTITGSEMYFEYFMKYNAFPSSESLLMCCLYKYMGSHVLPSDIKEWTDYIVRIHEPIIKLIDDKNMSYDDVKQIYKASDVLSIRIVLEDEYLESIVSDKLSKFEHKYLDSIS